MFHSPPAFLENRYNLDVVIKGKHVGAHVGNKHITPTIEARGPQLVVCGHIHEGFGIDKIGLSTVVNTSFVDEQFKVMNRHFEID